MYKVQPYVDNNNNDKYHLLDCDNNYVPVPEVESFLQYSALRGFSPFTLEAYAYDLMHYYNYCRKRGIDPLHMKDSHNVMDTFKNFTTELITRKHKHDDNIVAVEKPARTATTVNRIMSTVFNFYHYLSYTNMAELPSVFNASRMVRSRNFLSELVRARLHHYNLFLMKTEKHPVKYITREQFETLFDNCHTLRDKLIISLMFEGGLRCGEVCGIHVADLCDIDHGILHIVPRDNNINKARVKNHAKGKIKLSGFLSSMLTAYVVDRKYKSDYLFIIEKGENAGSPITRRTVTDLCKSLSKRTGMHIHPHMFRHGFAVEKIQDGWELFEVQSYLRHKNPASTTIYAEFTDEAKLKRMQEFNKTHGLDITWEDFDYVTEDI